MVTVSAVLLAQNVKADWNGNADITGLLDTFRATVRPVPPPADEDLAVRSAWQDYKGTAVFVYWCVPEAEYDQPWFGKVDVWLRGEPLRP